MSIVKKIINHLSDFMQVSESTKGIISFPKTGSSGLRLFLAQYIRLLEDKHLVLTLTELNAEMQEFGKNYQEKDGVNFVKTHHSIYSHKVSKYIMAYRCSKEVYVSYARYMFRRNRKHVGEFSYICKLAIFVFFLKRGSKAVRFAELEKNREKVLTELLVHFEIPFDQEKFAISKQYSEKTHFAKIENRGGFIAEYSDIPISIVGHYIIGLLDASLLRKIRFLDDQN